MKKQIRMGVFETNSSMCHALVMCSDEQYESWKKGDFIWDKWEGELVPVTDEIKNMDEDERSDEGLRTYEEFRDDEWFEIYEDTYTTPGGELVHAFGYYGHD